MRAIVIDDEELNIQLVENFCRRYAPSVELIGRADNVADGIEELVKKKPDLLFLDVEIHDQTGFDILNAVDQDDLMVIMVTAHPDYAIEACRARVMDYLLKPIVISEFTKAVGRCQKEYNLRNGTTEVTSKPEEKKEAPENQHINVHYREFIEIIPFDNILHLEAQGNYTLITTMDNVQHISSKPMKDYEEKLPEEVFLRVHKSHIVNVKGVSKYIRTRMGSLSLINGEEIPISETRKKEVDNRFLD